jgi:hypothetical protein
MRMNTSNESGIRKIEVDLLKFFFDAKRFTLEELEDHASGMFTTQMKLTELRDQLLTFVLSYKNKNSIFYIFLNGEREENLRLVIPTTDDPDHLTNRFAIIIDEHITEMEIKQLSLSSKILTLITNG